MRDLVRTELADEEIRTALAYLDERSPAAADRLFAQVDAKSELLRTNPFMGRARDEFRPGLRSVVIGDYLLFYRVTNEAIEFARFLHGSRDLPAAFADDTR
jgi:toxin ParE1/3/4